MSTGVDNPVDSRYSPALWWTQPRHRCVYCGCFTRAPVACKKCSDLLRVDPTFLVRSRGYGDEAA